MIHGLVVLHVVQTQLFNVSTRQWHRAI